MATSGDHDNDLDPGIGFNRQTITVPIGPLSRHARIALDIGGSLAKLAYIAESNNNEQSREISVHLVSFDADKIDEILEFIKNSVLIGPRNGTKPTIYGTGVGCSLHRQTIIDKLNVHLYTDHEELFHAAQGLSFLWQHLTLEELFYPESDTTHLSGKTDYSKSGLRSCCLTNIGSALTIQEVDENGKVKGVIGGGVTAGLTFLGLGALLTKCSSFDSLLRLSEQGSRNNVDLYVQDTAGAGYSVAPPDAMVSSFGRVAKLKAQNHDVKFAESDLAASLIYSIVEQLATNIYLVAKCHAIPDIVFIGSFMGGRRHIREQFKSKLQTCSSYLNFNVRTLFVRYESYLGAIGALTKHSNKNNKGHS